jgi:hypothetical protein
LIYDQAWLDKRTARWKKRLRVQDWNTEVSFARRWELGEEIHAHCDMLLSKKHAVIKVMDPRDDGPPERFAVDDPEQGLIHELVHLLIEPMLTERHHDNESAEYYAMEQAVDALAGAFYGLEMELREAKG